MPEVIEVTLLITNMYKESQIQIGFKQHISVTVGLISLVIVVQLLRAVSKSLCIRYPMTCILMKIFIPSPSQIFFFCTMCEKT
jgi:hypothetical protein